MVSIPFMKKKQAVRLSDDEKGAAFETDATRFDEKRARIPSQTELAQSTFAPHPAILRFIRFLMWVLLRRSCAELG